MKLALGNTLSSNKPGGGRSTDLIVDAFKRRVDARVSLVSLGYTSGLNCLTAQLNAIKNID
jgi:hypothetical protein